MPIFGKISLFFKKLADPEARFACRRRCHANVEAKNANVDIKFADDMARFADVVPTFADPGAK